MTYLPPANVDLEILRKEAKANPEFQKVMKFLATEKDRGRSETTFVAFKRLLKYGPLQKDWSEEQINDFLKVYEKAKAGHIIHGRGEPRIAWKYNHVDVSRAALSLPPAKKWMKPGDIRQTTGKPITHTRATPDSLQSRGSSSDITTQTLDFLKEINPKDLTPRGLEKFLMLLSTISGRQT